MGNLIYLDIDLDYFVMPVEKASVDNIRVFYDRDCVTFPVKPVADKLSEAGLTWDKNNVHCFTNHKKSYTYWWIAKKTGCTVIHIDAHSDLYRNRQRDLRLLSNGDIGCYNYLWYAVRDGYVDEIYWVVPESQSFLISEEGAGRIIDKSLIKSSTLDDSGLHIYFSCIDIKGKEKEIPLHVMKIEMLPNMDAECSIVTIATSPEFIPEKADSLVPELLDCFGADESVKANILNQHKDLLKKPGSEVAAARIRLGIE